MQVKWELYLNWEQTRSLADFPKFSIFYVKTEWNKWNLEFCLKENYKKYLID